MSRREVDAFLSANGPPFRFDRKKISPEAEIALLILHDTLNGVDYEALAAVPDGPVSGDDRR